MTMRRDEQTQEPEDIDAPRTSRRTGDTDRLKARADDQGLGSPIRRDWRSSRSTNRPPRRAAALPSTWQEFVIWLQHEGGLKYVIGGAVVVVLILVLMVSLSGGARPMATSDTQQGMTLEPQPTITPGVSEPTPDALSQTGAQFLVTGTDTEGLFLRPDHSTEGAPITTLPEGTVVTVIGPDFVGPDRVWKNVRTLEGQEGWVASDFVRPLQ